MIDANSVERILPDIQQYRIAQISNWLVAEIRDLLIEEGVAHGCGLGVEYPFIWYREDEEWGAYDGVFEENRVVCVECYAGEPGGEEGVKLEQPVWIRESGPALLSQFPIESDYLI